MVTRTDEGGVRPGPWLLPVSGGWLPATAGFNWFQQGYTIESGERSVMIEACDFKLFVDGGDAAGRSLEIGTMMTGATGEDVVAVAHP